MTRNEILEVINNFYKTASEREVAFAREILKAKKWIDITDGELYDLWLKTPAETADKFAFVRAALAKLKEKNSG